MNDLEKAKDLKKRLTLFRQERDHASDNRHDFIPSFSWGLRLGIEWIAHVLGGVGLGYGIDYVLGIKPWGLMLGLIVGTVAGFLSVYRTLFTLKQK